MTSMTARISLTENLVDSSNLRQNSRIIDSSQNTLSADVQNTDESQKAEVTPGPMLAPSSLSMEPPHHIFTKKRKWIVVYIVSIAGMFSPLSSNIYFPAINTISDDLHVNASLVALTITIYMVVQGIAPSFWGPLSDGPAGRRSIFACTLTLYSVANLALAFTNSFPMLLILRGIQAAGSAATISIGTGVIADIAAPSERGGFIGTNSGIRMIGQALGPLIGGILNSIWGFRSIFWLLFILSILVLFLLLIFLPETHRAIAGNGSVPLHGFHRPFIYLITSPPKEWSASSSSFPSASPPPKPRVSFAAVFIPLKQLFEKDIFVLTAWGALIYAVWSMVTSSTTTVLINEFPTLTNLQLGLCFLPNGLGCVLGSIGAGKLMDHNFRRTAKLYRLEHNLSASTKIPKNDKQFPYERARLACVPHLSALFVLAVILYGSSYELNDVNRAALANLIISLVLQFFIAGAATAVFSVNSAMLVDCFPSGGAGAAAVNNLARCTMGALGVSVIEPMIEAIKIRNTFVVLAGIVTGCSPLIWLEWKWGRMWRLRREERIEGKGKGRAEGEERV